MQGIFGNNYSRIHFARKRFTGTKDAGPLVSSQNRRAATIPHIKRSSTAHDPPARAAEGTSRVPVYASCGSKRNVWPWPHSPARPRPAQPSPAQTPGRSQPGPEPHPPQSMLWFWALQISFLSSLDKWRLGRTFVFPDMPCINKVFMRTKKCPLFSNSGRSSAVFLLIKRSSTFRRFHSFGLHRISFLIVLPKEPPGRLS